MAQCDPYRTLARQLSGSLETSKATGNRVAQYLTREEWALEIEALRQTAEPPAPRKRAPASPKPEGGAGAT